MIKHHLLWPMAVLVLSGACGPLVTSTPIGTGTYPPHVEDREILLFSVRAPECPFEEISLITARQRHFTSRSATLEALKTRARELGGEAVAGLRELHAVPDSEHGAGFSGTVIRFQEPDCRR